MTTENIDEWFESSLTDKDKNFFKIRSSISKTFLIRLQEKFQDFNKINDEDIINLMYPDIVNNETYISTQDMCKQIGIEMIPIRNEDYANKNGTIFLDNDSNIVIMYDKKNNPQERRVTRLHELGHFFRHLLPGTITSANSLKNNHKRTDMDKQYDIEADDFKDTVLRMSAKHKNS